MIKKTILTISLFTFNFILFTNGYLFGIKSFDNTIENIVQIEEKYDFDFPVVAFIFDPRDETKISNILNNVNNKFGIEKIYHISLSPNNYSAKQVSEGIFDQNYKKFFELVKKNDLKIIFRTMHEMNGGRYPRGSHPENFQKARIHVRNLSREVGLDQNNIMFDMSVNHRDMPTKGVPSQKASLITCNQKNKFITIEDKIFISTGYKTETIEKKVPIKQSKIDKLLKRPIQYSTKSETIKVEYPIYKTETEKKQNCFTFEDYYPGEKYVDIMGVTFYNRGKAGYNRHWLLPEQILNDKNRDTLKRLKSFKKPIFIDEVATTAVRYNGAYNQQSSQKSYINDYNFKNNRLVSLKNFMLKNPEILGMVYFNIDYTNGLSKWMIGESDRAIINLNNNKFYTGTYELYNNQSKANKIFNLSSKTNLEQTTQIENKNSQLLVNLLIEKFGAEESRKRIESIVNITDNSNLKNLLNESLYIINTQGKEQK